MVLLDPTNQGWSELIELGQTNKERGTSRMIGRRARRQVEVLSTGYLHDEDIPSLDA